MPDLDQIKQAEQVRVHKTYGGKIVDERYSAPGMAVPLAIKDRGSRWPKPNAGPCPCQLRASSTIASSGWQLAGGTALTGQPSVCSPRSMRI
jgi:hypothetical protein